MTRTDYEYLDHHDMLTEQERWFYQPDANGDPVPRFTIDDARRVVNSEAPASTPGVRETLAYQLFNKARAECDGLQRVWLRMR